MDPLTHALLGATAAQIVAGARLGRRALLCGALGGVLPDLDIVIRSTSDPLLAIQYHRHFTHALLVIPLGGMASAAPWLLRARHRVDWLPLLLAGTCGYATHGVLDACTNYGTHLLWPFSPLRVAWHWITTIGPLLTLLLLAGLVVAVRWKSRLPAAIALVAGLIYVGTAAWQRERALEIQAAIAAMRGHELVRAEMFPTVGNPVVWRSVYQVGDTLYTDRVRVLGAAGARWKPGGSLPLLLEYGLPAEFAADARIRRDFARFQYFSAGWTARAASDASVIGDARYSLHTDRFEPIWGVRFHPGADRATEWVDRTTSNRLSLGPLWQEIAGTAAGYQPVPAASSAAVTTVARAPVSP